MHWILQKNLISPIDLARFELALQERNTPYSLVTLIPFFHELIAEPQVPAGPVFVYGSTGLCNVARARGWTPGYFDENLDYELMLTKFGPRTLNAATVCAAFGDLMRTWDRFFIRPTLDSKSFAGAVMTWEQLETFRDGVAKVSADQDVTLRLSDRVVMAPLLDIWEEYRFFVVDGEVVTGSRYKAGIQISTSDSLPSSVAQFAQECINHWCPNKAFTLDIAVTAKGAKVIELNSANSAGVYACDVGKFVDAVNTRLLS